MAVQYQLVSWPIFGGVDTKVDGYVLPAPRLQEAFNVYSDLSGSLQRRYGSLQLANTVSNGGVSALNWAATATFKTNLVGYTNGIGGTVGKIYEYSDGLDRWVEKGPSQSFRVRSDVVFSGLVSQGIAAGSMDSARAGAVVVYAGTTYVPSTSTTIYLTVRDDDGTIYVANESIYSVNVPELTTVRVIALGTFVYVFFYSSGTGRIRVLPINTTSATTINASVNAGAVDCVTDPNVTTPVYDVAANATSAKVWIVYNQATANTIKWGFVSTTGVLSSTSTHAATGAPATITGEVNSTNTNFGFAYSRATTPSDVYIAIKAWNGAAWSATTSSGAVETTLTGGIYLAGSLWTNTTTYRVWYQGNAPAGPGNGNNVRIMQTTFTTSGTVGLRVETLRHAWASSQPFVGSDGLIYQWVYAGIPSKFSQPTHFLMRNDDTNGRPKVAAMANQGVAYLPLSVDNQPSVVANGSSYSVTMPYLNRVTATAETLNIGTDILARDITVDMVHTQSHATMEVASTLYSTGGVLMQYDGVSSVEAGFLQFVNTTIGDGSEVTIAASTTAVPGVATGTYAYRIVPEWVNAKGQREQGTDSGSISFGIVGPNNTITITIPTHSFTLKQYPFRAMTFAVYRTQGTITSDSPFYRVGVIANDPANDTVAYVDVTTDVASNEEFYQDGGVLENTAPPPGYLLAQGGQRQFISGFADDPNLILASKLRSANEPVMFSDALTITIPETGGAITAMEVMGETLVVFKEYCIYRLRADVGPDNTGTQGGFLPAELVSADLGCTTARGVVVTPAGIMFRSSKGFMLLNQGYQVEYVGSQLEKAATTPGTLVGATLLADVQQVRFTHTIHTYVYDYYHKQWYVWTRGSAVATTAWNGVEVGSINDQLHYDSLTTFVDGVIDYTATVTLGWEKLPTSLQGNMRVRRIALTGQSLAAHNLQIFISHDFAVYSQVITPTAPIAAGVLRVQSRLNQQISSAVEVTVRDAIIGIYGFDEVQATAGIKMNEVTFEVALRNNSLARR